MKRILLLYYIPKDTKKAKVWNDGFTKGIDYLERRFEISRINLDLHKPDRRELDTFDFIIAKSNWNWIVDKYLRNYKRLKAKRGIVISGSIPLPTKAEMLFYDVLYYQTKWYRTFISEHPFVVHSYGIDNSIMKPIPSTVKDIDYLSIGMIVGYKRFEKLAGLSGKRVVVGALEESDPGIIETLKKSGVDILPYKNYDDLCVLINRSKVVYLPCEVHGGGERALMEAMACNVEVEIMDDNPKLQELLYSPNYSQSYYSNQIEYGVCKVLNEDFPEDRFFHDGNSMIYSGIESYHGSGFELSGDAFVSIGNYCTIGDNVKIYTSGYDNDFAANQNMFYYKYFDKDQPGNIQPDQKSGKRMNNIEIGNDVWIGNSVIIKGGVKIGNGARIEDGSVISSNVPAFSVFGGQPARVKKYRFSEDVIKDLQNKEWWYWIPNRIMENEEFFFTNLND